MSTATDCATPMRFQVAPMQRHATTTVTPRSTMGHVPNSTTAAFAVALVPFTSAAARTFRKATAIAMATNWTPLGCAEATARKTSTRTTFVTRTSKGAPIQPTPTTIPTQHLMTDRALWAVAPSPLRATTTLTRITKSKVLATSQAAQVAPTLRPATTILKRRWTMACATCLTSRTIVTATA